MFIDTHTHIYTEEFDADRAEVVERARKAGARALLLPNIDEASLQPMMKMAEDYPGFCFPMMGLHPTELPEDPTPLLDRMEQMLSETPEKFVAVGEVGIDLYWDKSYLKEQKKVFEEQLLWSIDLRLPVAIHTREAFPEVFDILYKVGPEKLTGVFHSFTGSAAELEEIKKLTNFKIGINGVITFKNSKLSEVIQQTDLQQIVLETDAPYLAPVPYRGKRNEPVYIWKTAEKIAQVYGLPLETVVETTRKNALHLFKIENQPI